MAAASVFSMPTCQQELCRQRRIPLLLRRKLIGRHKQRRGDGRRRRHQLRPRRRRLAGCGCQQGGEAAVQARQRARQLGGLSAPQVVQGGTRVRPCSGQAKPPVDLH